ncbi:MAG: 2-phospho-L-lactate guanylyltransferase [Novosphingobium sp.]
MTTWVVIPAKALVAAKGRLAGVLSADDRNRLAASMLRTAIFAASEAVGADRVAIVGSAPADIDDAILVIPEPVGGLNAALDYARQDLAGKGATRIVSLAADLPQVSAADVLALVELPQSGAGIAPDRHGTGTNALSLPLPAALDFAYHYGPGSCERHLAEAARIGIVMRRIERSALARDVDEPGDLEDAQGLLVNQQG